MLFGYHLWVLFEGGWQLKETGLRVVDRGLRPMNLAYLPFPLGFACLDGGDKLQRKPSCPLCNPENFIHYDLQSIKTN